MMGPTEHFPLAMLVAEGAANPFPAERSRERKRYSEVSNSSFIHYIPPLSRFLLSILSLHKALDFVCAVGSTMAHHESFVVVHNIAKRHNIGTMARSATAFGVSELILVGRRDFNAFGSHGSTSHLRFRHFHSLCDARLYLTNERDCDICGVEIADGAVAVSKHPFRRSTAFLLGNEGTGLSAKESEICDFFVYIPQYGCGTASLNVTVAASIVLHHFGVWAGFAERSRDGNKFIVAERPIKQVRRNYCAETAESVVEERKSRRENSCDFFDESRTDDSQSSNLLDVLFTD